MRVSRNALTVSLVALAVSAAAARGPLHFLPNRSGKLNADFGHPAGQLGLVASGRMAAPSHAARRIADSRDEIRLLSRGKNSRAPTTSFAQSECSGQPDGTPCMDDGNECTDDTCAAGLCDHPPLSAGTACGNPTPEGFCDNPDMCNGAGTCIPSFEPATTQCRASTDQEECDPAEYCTGASPSCPADVLLWGAPCTDDGDECTDDICVTGLCAHPLSSAGTPCGNPTPEGLCDNPDVCDGAGNCEKNYEPATTECRAATDACDPAEFCPGVWRDCPADVKSPDGSQCTDDGDPCTDDVCAFGVCGHPYNTAPCDDADPCTDNDVCSGGVCAGTFNPTCITCVLDSECDDGNDCTDDLCPDGACDHPVFSAGTPCGAPTPEGPCDNPDACDAFGQCWPNSKPATTECRPSTDECDPAEYCTGWTAECPNDAILDAGTPCGDPIPEGLCDNPDICDGAGTCDPNYEPATTECRASLDVECDPAGFCCDPAEFCTGVLPSCPTDFFLPNFTPCADDGSECTDDTCNSGVCDHPPWPAGTACGDQSNTVCDNPDTCDVVGVCQSNFEPATLVCRPSTNECDPAESCTGSLPGCPGDAFEPDDTPCTDDGDQCTRDVCVGGVCDNPPLGPGMLELDKLTASDAAGGDDFGGAVSVSGDLVLVGARLDDDAGDKSGAAYILERSGASWAEQAKLTASDASAGDQFGISVSISGTVAVVGASLDDDDGNSSGSAYAFRWDGASWVEEAKLTASDAADSDQFGVSVAISGNRIVVGAKFDDDAGGNSGAAYVFNWNGLAWIEEAKLTSLDAAGGDNFGGAVSISGDVILVGAHLAGPPSAGDAGAAYVFRYGGASWNQEAKLTASDAAGGDNLGNSVAIDGDVALLGAWLDDDGGNYSGSAYVFRWDGASWQQEQKLTAADAASNDYFGTSVGLAGDWALVGARGDDDAGSGSGSAYLFSRQGGSWAENDKFVGSDAAAGDAFGTSVAIAADSAVIGANKNDLPVANAGSAYAFALSEDCNLNGIMDVCDIIRGGMSDCNANNLPDECEPDCNSNGVADSCDIAACAGDQACNDCQPNGVPDGCDISLGTSLDANTNGVPDECDDCTGDAQCDDGNECTSDVCDLGVCTHLGLADGTACTDDGNECTNDRCSSGVCNHPNLAAGTACGNPTPQGGCDNPDVCDGAGTCISDYEPATTDCRPSDDCDPAEFCTGNDPTCPPDVFTPDGTTCTDDGVECTDDVCTGGVCTHPDLPDGATCTDDGIECTEDVCSTGMCIHPDSVAGTQCGDPTADDCTAADTCDGLGVCVPNHYTSGTACTDDLNDCTDDRCDGAGTCTHPNLADGTACADDGNDCTDDVCAFGDCGHPYNTAPCDDADPCTDNDMCSQGACAGTDIPGCIGCDLDAECDDGNLCTEDLCAGGTCQHPLLGPGTAEFGKLTASDAAGGDDFGGAVSVSGDLVLVGARLDDDAGTSSGSAYVFELSGASWIEQAKLTASDEAGGDQFGISVSISGSVAVVGASLDDDDGTNSGSAYVFRWNGASWVEEAKLTASDAAGSDQFGVSVAISGNRIVVGAKFDDDAGGTSGAAYVFSWNGLAWIEEAKLTSLDAAGGDNFGGAVSISGNVILVGAHLADSPSDGDAGAAYVFRYSGASWDQEAKLTASDQAASDNLGYSVAIDGDVALVGSWLDDDGGSSSGSAYMFRWDGSSWQQEDKLTAADGAGNDYFGTSVGLAGDWALVGARGDDDAGSGSGSAYLFAWQGGSWAEDDKFVGSDAAAGDAFGISVALTSGSAVVGANKSGFPVANAGSTYAFAVSGDCQPNGAMDLCDIIAGSSGDCNGNSLPDECEPDPDCNGNGIQDICELTGNDCNTNGVPDECESTEDCNGNGVLDICDLGDGTSADCNSNGIPDDCDVDPGDPDNNGQTSPDCNFDSVPDECEPDCNNNLVADSCDIADCTGETWCDDCQPNGIPDVCDSPDLNGNGIPDDCEECTFSWQCSGGVSCTSDECVDGSCVYTPIDGLCNDGDLCTDDACDETNGCSNLANYQIGVDCCDPDTADLTTISDGNDCTTDACDPQTGQVTHTPIPAGSACDDAFGCTDDDQCDGTGNCSGTPTPDCVPCDFDFECDDGVACTNDLCVDYTCQNPNGCQDDGLFCTGEESCNLTSGNCESSGNPCPGLCTEVNGCPCEEPIVAAAGARYLSIRPQPPELDAPVKLLVSSPDFPCLSEYVGYLACGGDGEACSTDADCNACTGSGAPCIADTDCRTCSDLTTYPCQTDADCNPGASCAAIQTCTLSGTVCRTAAAPAQIDIDRDGIIDGTVATLVTDPADALSLTPQEWVGFAQDHCSLAKTPCVEDSDCVEGRCLYDDGRPSGVNCNILAQDCGPGETCGPAEICMRGAVYVTGEKIVPSEDIDLLLVPTVYEVRADCGIVTSPATATMMLWADTAEANNRVNVTDIQFILLVIQGKFDVYRQRTLLTTDLVADAPCRTNQKINATDLQRALRAFLGETYRDAVLSSASVTGCRIPCQ